MSIYKSTFLCNCICFGLLEKVWPFSFRNLWISPLMQPDKETWIQKAEDFFVHGRSQVLGPETLIRHLKDSRISELATFRSQVELLTSIPNFHWWNQVRQDGSEIRSEPQVNYSQHLLFHPDMDAEDPARRYRYKPCSPRHQIMDFLSNNNLHLRKVVKHMLSIDRGEGKSAIPLHRPLPSQGLASDAQVASNPTADHMDYSEEIPVPPPRKRRKHGPRIKSLSAQAYCQQMDIAYEQVITPNDQEIRSQYKSFVEDVLSAGRIQKRFEQHGVQVYLINDYSVTTGVMAPNKYVHLTAMEQDGQTLIKCTCQAYEQLQGTSNAGYGQTLRESAWLDSQLTCMHARLFREECLDLNEGSNFAAKITPIPDEPDDVHLIDQPYLHSATKFSVAGERYGFVHVWFENGQCMVQCQDQYCHATLLKKKKQKLKKKKGKCSSNHPLIPWNQSQCLGSLWICFYLNLFLYRWKRCSKGRSKLRAPCPFLYAVGEDRAFVLPVFWIQWGTWKSSICTLSIPISR